jgi:dTDP-4-amino-4,6-dideoxygalactose transaminase
VNSSRIIKAIAQKYNLKILEDGAQGFGGAINRQRACSFGDAATTSFFPAKPLGSYGDGGAIFTSDDKLDEVLRSIRAQGRSPEDKYDNRTIGLNSRLDTIQAAILLAKLKAFEDYEVKAVNRVAARYTSQLKDIVVTPYIPDGYLSSWAQYTILLENKEQRDGLQKHLKEQSIPSITYYPRGMHSQTVMKDFSFIPDAFPNTDKVSQTCLSLPMHPYMPDEDIDYISKVIVNYCKS